MDCHGAARLAMTDSRYTHANRYEVPDQFKPAHKETNGKATFCLPYGI